MIQCNITNSDDPIKQIMDCLNILNQIDQKAQNKSITLDMGNIDWMSPFSALILSSKISLCLSQKIKIETIPPNKNDVRGYLSAIGFPLGKIRSGKSYSPIHHFSNNANIATNKVYEIIDKTFPDVLRRNVVKYIIGELCDNIDQHSCFTHASIMAQFYKSKNFVDIGVIDNGISIPRNFYKNGIKFYIDAHAIDKALNGLSTKKQEGRGKGLITTRGIVEEGLRGELYIISRNGALATGHGHARKLYKLGEHKLNGTVAYARFTVPKTEVDVYNYIK